jgi:hypothetical protein
VQAGSLLDVPQIRSDPVVPRILASDSHKTPKDQSEWLSLHQEHYYDQSDSRSVSTLLNPPPPPAGGAQEASSCSTSTSSNFDRT